MVANAAEIRDEYLRLRAVQRELNSRLLKTLSKKGFDESARDLGLRDTVLDEDRAATLADYALYEYRAGGKSAVERYASKTDAAGGSDERIVLDAMLKAEFTLVGIEEVVPEVGARAIDRLYERRFLLADQALSTSGYPQLVMATRLLPFERFTMTSGAPLRFDTELADLFLDGLRDAFGVLPLEGQLPLRLRRQLARNLIDLATGDPDETACGCPSRTR